MQNIKTLTINGSSYALLDADAQERLAALQTWVDAQQTRLEVLEEARQQMEKAVEDTASPVVCSASGKGIFLADAAQRKLRGLTLYGRTDENLESAGSSGAIGVTVTGKNLFDLSTMRAKNCVTSGEKFYAVYKYAAANIPVVPGQTYTISAYVRNNTVHTGLLTLSVQDGYEVGYGTGTKLGQCVGATTEWRLATLTFTALSDYVSISTNAQLRKDVMLEQGSAATAYAPYTAQTLSVATPNGLPGIPVESGGNYTDESGQMWVCDEIDLAQSVYMQRVDIIESYAGEKITTPYMGELTEGARVLYGIDPVETALEQTLSLRTNYPDTGIFNDAGAGMAVTYVADTKRYIDKAIT